MNTLDSLRDLQVPTITTLMIVLAVAALVVVEPVLGRRQYSELVTDLAAAADDAEQDAVRRRFYRSWTWQGWLIGALAVAVVMVLPGTGLADLGLRLPDVGELLPDAGRDDAAGMVVGAIVGLALAGGALALVRRWLPGRSPLQSSAIDILMPTTPGARRGWAGLSLSAGVTEEITYRGLLVLALTLAVPDLAHGAVVAVAAVLFGIAHWYQGRLGMLTTGAVGAVLTQLYLTTGSLLLPMVVHVLIDLRLLLDRPAPARAPALADAR
ncbi:CPBP family intramembrane glutamic endopeptidase [Cellulomonas sp. Leaf395]|uniref:CPBP family intramembrane glutamic endopeptidase n=1 Tax=Cellulomonas sp. Leaf395 TaxID=1736362 RepID=UPI0006F4E173|nr:CPBP family intramembrane glutamic endopeptidase [Cellulomonas sp. Leaf395]KQT01364.1 hypothetical protein ASG23_07330 [Cellulomonas sp. Leaf395]